MDTAKCKAFITAAETGSLTKAAEILNYTPSGVSQLITAFENELGVKLLSRTKKGVAATSNGEKIIPYLRDYVQQENSVFQLASEMNGLVVGSVSIATYASIGMCWLPQIIADFQRDYPNIKIKVIEGSHSDQSHLLDNKQADIAFFSYKPQMKYDWIPVKEDRMIAILPENHPYAGKDKFPIKQCENEHLIFPCLGQDDDVLTLFDELGVNVDVEYATSETSSSLAMVENGLGMSVMNELITTKWPWKVAKVPLDPPRSITLGIAIPSLKHAAPAVGRFVQYAVKWFEANI